MSSNNRKSLSIKVLRKIKFIVLNVMRFISRCKITNNSSIICGKIDVKFAQFRKKQYLCTVLHQYG